MLLFDKLNRSSLGKGEGGEWEGKGKLMCCDHILVIIYFL